MLKRLSKASRSGSAGRAASAESGWEEAGSTNPNTPVIEDPGGPRSGPVSLPKTESGDVNGEGSPREAAQEEEERRLARKRSSTGKGKLFSRLTSKFSRSLSALLHSDGSGASHEAAGRKAAACGNSRDERAGELDAPQSASGEPGVAAAHDASFAQKRKFHIPHPHLLGHHSRALTRQHLSGSGGAAADAGAEPSGHGIGTGILHAATGLMHPSHLPHLHLRSTHAKPENAGQQHTPRGQQQQESENGVQGVELLRQLHQAHERARKIVEDSRKQKEILLQRARQEVEEEAVRVREEAEKEFEVAAETDQKEDAAFAAATDDAPVDPHVPRTAVDEAAQFCVGQVLLVDVGLPEELKKRLPVIKANPPTFFRKSCASQYPSTRGPKGDPTILKAALEHSYRQSREYSEAHYGSASLTETMTDEYRGACLKNLGGSSEVGGAKRDVYSAILGDRAWNEADEADLHLDINDVQGQEDDNQWWASRRKGNDDGSVTPRAFCQGCWPAAPA
ncbi:vacuolar (h+)-atpase g subunit protein [Besnoitia besnoiti]|uniref:Vacuolar (H+)-atpase g subunit protein n=1 Tax=Besnoitia besnoiti TaxID=94643 RepID=A0A2A9MG85_BESBE|nr:vacuolar (h+)-atpase g subunit protein [Besnoitia besnoiti]PFH34986.1 vacuolar (h+)-atpase g subunit protein [Besnoitia besnoiti]